MARSEQNGPKWHLLLFGPQVSFSLFISCIQLTLFIYLQVITHLQWCHYPERWQWWSPPPPPQSPQLPPWATARRVEQGSTERTGRGPLAANNKEQPDGEQQMAKRRQGHRGNKGNREGGLATLHMKWAQMMIDIIWAPGKFFLIHFLYFSFWLT